MGTASRNLVPQLWLDRELPGHSAYDFGPSACWTGNYSGTLWGGVVDYCRLATNRWHYMASAAWKKKHVPCMGFYVLGPGSPVAIYILGRLVPGPSRSCFGAHWCVEEQLEGGTGRLGTPQLGGGLADYP